VKTVIAGRLVLCSLLICVGAAVVAVPHRPAAAAVGASLPFIEYQAEDAATNGALIGPDRAKGTLASEASGRRAVTLSGAGRYVEFTLSGPANAVTVHFSIPDSGSGTGLSAPLAVYVNGVHQQDLTLTSRYAWQYGNNPFTNSPADGNPHHFYDDVRTRFPSTLPAGTRVRLQVDSGSTPTTIDAAGFEQVPAPLALPSGALSVTSFGADPSGAGDSSNAFDAAVSAASAQGKVLWIPPGTYTVTRHIVVDNVTIRGAGPWYSVLHGTGVGVYGRYPPSPSHNVKLSDFAILGEVTDRVDSAQVNGIGGALGGGSVVSDIWIQHTKVAMWLDGPFDGLTVTGCRFLDLMADGLNLHDGISHVTVSQTYVRNSGDDGLAMWSENHADHDNTFSANTVVLPMLANGIAIYGGRDNTVTNNIVADVVTDGGGLHVANRFGAVPLAGTTTLARNTVMRTGGIWFYAADSSMTGTVNVTDSDFIDVSDAIAAYGFGPSVSNLTFTDIRIHGASGFVLAIHANGSATFSGVVATNAAGSVYNCGNAFTVNLGAGNSGWSTGSTCGPPSGQHVGAITGIAGKCVDISGGNSNAGTAVQLYTCNGTAAQRWTVNADGSLRALGSNCLDVSGGGTVDGTKVQLWPCNGTGAQVWQAHGNALVNPQSGKCLDDPWSSTADGTQLQIWTCNGTAAQGWTLP
jgi:Alpha-1,3-glucanase catalytic domain D1/Ricin-type beta-trefoil lectin domain/Alpha-1,3-glucanase catalytic domain D2